MMIQILVALEACDGGFFHGLEGIPLLSCSLPPVPLQTLQSGQAGSPLYLNVRFHAQ